MNTSIQSSVDPTKISLTIESLANFIGFIIGYYLMKKGFDPSVATNIVQYIADTTVTIIPTGFAMWHGVHAIFGAIRKLVIYSTTGKTLPVDNSIAVTSTN